MAKSDFGSKQELQEYLAGLKQIDAQYKILNAEAKKLRDTPGGAKQQVQQQLKDLRTQYDSHKEILASIKLANKELESFINNQNKIAADGKKSAKVFEDMVDSFGELDGLQHSITAQFGKNHVQTKAMQAVAEKTKAQYNGIKSILDNTGDIQQHQRDSVESALEIYKNFPVTLNNLNNDLKKGKISQEGFNAAVIGSVDEYSNFVSQLDTSNVAIAQMKERMLEILPIMDKFKVAAEETKKEFENIDAVAAGLNFGVGGISGASQIISNAAEIRKNMISGMDLKTLTLVGAAIGTIELTAQFEGAALAAARADNAIETGFLDAELAIIETSLALDNFLPDKKALIDYKYELKKMVAEFDAASQTAFFGNGIGSLQYNTAQLQLAGISAKEISSAMTELAMSGNTAIAGLGEEVAVFSAKTGIGSGEVANLIGLFRMLDKTNGASAYGDVTGGLSAAFSGGFNPADIANEMKDAGALALDYNIQSSEQLMKQVKSVRELGASWSKIAEAGKSMVLNYKDSIRKEMELSAMLGESVDLSEARALFAAGKSDEAFGVLKSSGILEKAQSQGLFAVQALQGALGGMDLQQLNKAPLEKMAGGMPSNAEFLNKLTEAQKTLRIANARITIENQQEIEGQYKPFETMILRGDKSAIDKAGELIRQDAQNFAKESAAKLFAGGMGGGGAEAYNKFKDKLPFGMGGMLPEMPNLYKEAMKWGGGYNEELGTDFSKYHKNKDRVYDYDYLPGGKSTSSINKSNQFNVEESSRIQDNMVKNQNKIATNSDLQTKSLGLSATSLNGIDTQSVLQTQLLQNIQALTAATSNLENIGLGDMKLLLDGKEVKSRIEKIGIRETGKMRV